MYGSLKESVIYIVDKLSALMKLKKVVGKIKEEKMILQRQICSWEL